MRLPHSTQSLPPILLAQYSISRDFLTDFWAEGSEILYSLNVVFTDYRGDLVAIVNRHWPSLTARSTNCLRGADRRLKAAARKRREPINS